MSLWIRSQDRYCLIECTSVGLIERNNDEFKIGTYLNEKTQTLGVYSTKEKALKVLDMIQREINNELIRDYMVFKMPQDDEVK